MTRGSAFRSLRVRNYRIWAAGAIVSNVGTWMQRVAQDWLVLAGLTRGSASALGLIMALQFAPQFLFLPWTGLAADRLDQRRLLLATQLAMGAAALVLGALTIAGVVRLWEVAALSFAFGIAAAFDAPVRQAFVAELVGDDDLPNAIALNSTSTNAGRMVGPAVAGLVIAATGPGWAIVLNGLSYGAVALSLLSLQEAELRPNMRAAPRPGALLEGLAYVRSRPDLKAVLLMLLLIGAFGLNFPLFISTMALRVLHTDARGFGLLTTVAAVGTLAGTLVAAGRGRAGLGTLAVSAAAFGIASLAAAVAPGFITFAAALVAMGIASLVFQTATSSIVQLATVPAMRGRVLAIRLAVYLGGAALGAPVLGWVADRAGPRWALAAAAASGLAAAGLAVRSITGPGGNTRNAAASELSRRVPPT